MSANRRGVGTGARGERELAGFQIERGKLWYGILQEEPWRYRTTRGENRKISVPELLLQKVQVLVLGRMGKLPLAVWFQARRRYEVKTMGKKPCRRRYGVTRIRQSNVTNLIPVYLNSVKSSIM